MKILGHVYVALKSVPAKNKELIIWGSILPEMMFYVEENPFKFEEIHEGGERVVEYLREKKPEWVDLGLGLITHSKNKGADYFDGFEQIKTLGYVRGENSEFEKLIAESANLKNIKIVQARAHNILDLALDLYISRHYPWALDELKRAFKEISVPDLAEVLAECFRKERGKVEAAIYKLKEKVIPGELTTVEGLAKTWTRFSRNLEEHKEQEINVVKTQHAIEEAVKMIKGREEAFLNSAVEWTRKNLEQISTYSKEHLF